MPGRSGEVPTVDTSTFRVASRVIPLPGEPREITRPSAVVQRRRSRRRRMTTWILAGIALIALVAAVIVVIVALTSGAPDAGAEASLSAVTGVEAVAAQGERIGAAAPE